MKIADGMKRVLVLGLSLFATAGAKAVEEIGQVISKTTSKCDVWEVCCASDRRLDSGMSGRGLACRTLYHR